MSFDRVTRLDAMTVRTVNDKNYWTRIGVAFPAKQGPGWNVLLDAMPAPVDGQFKIMLMEPKERTEDAPVRSNGTSGGYGEGKARVASSAPAFDNGDDIPFAPEMRG